MVLCDRLENSNLTDKALLAHDGIPTFLTKRYNPAWASELAGEVNRAGKKKQLCKKQSVPYKNIPHSHL